MLQNGHLIVGSLAVAIAAWVGPVASAQQEEPEEALTIESDESPMPVGVTVSEHMTVDLHLNDEDLATVLQMLAIQAQKNIVASQAVNATVSANLYGVTFYEALDAILHVNGYGYIERGNFIYVYTLDELSQIQEAQRRPVAKVITLDYLNANDAAEFVAPLLSEVGQIKTNGDVDTFNIPDSPVGDESFALAATLVIFDFPEHIEEIEKLIEQLDTRPTQVLVEATVLQTDLTEMNAFGVDFSIVGNLDLEDFTGIGGPLSAVNNMIGAGNGDAGGGGGAPQFNDGFATVSTPGNTAGPATFKLGILQDDFALFLRALDSVGDTTVLSNPKLLALNRQPARVLVGERLGYLSTTATETSTTQTVEFLDTGTQLAFRPFVSSDGMIRMELRPSVSQGFIRQATDSNGVTVSIPDEATQELTTNVIVRDGATIVLGGLFKESTTISRRQVPILGDIPIIGAPFRGHDDDVRRSEIIFMITPTIMRDNALIAQGERAASEVESVRTGARSGLLPFSRERMTAQLNLEAEDLARQGEYEKALWKLRRSLELHPNQPDARRLRDRLGGGRDRAPSRSILQEIVGPDVLSDLEAPSSMAPMLDEAEETASAPKLSDPFLDSLAEALDAMAGGDGAHAAVDTTGGEQ